MDKKRIIDLTVEDFTQIMHKTISGVVAKIPQEQKEEILLKRIEVAKRFSVSLVTLNKWCRTGKIKSYHIGSRVFFKEAEVMAALQAVQKYNRNSNSK